MTKSIGTLIKDIETVVLQPHEFTEGALDELGKAIARDVSEQINPKEREPTLRMSNVGTKCNRKLWFEINRPDLKEPFDFTTRMKFLMGTILENIVLFLAKEAGHKVEGEQDEMEIAGIKGHRDAVIDGMLVDVKSASSRSFKKFQNHLEYGEDSFGYLDQIQSYLEASQGDPKVEQKNKAAFLVIDKQFGDIALDVHSKGRTDYKAFMEMKKEVVNAKTMPPRGFEDEPSDSPKGNRMLSTVCTYCPFKRACWPNLRTYAYADGKSLKFFTEVNNPPRVPEVETPGKDYTEKETT
jgi:hypothetical protein